MLKDYRKEKKKISQALKIAQEIKKLISTDFLLFTRDMSKWPDSWIARSGRINTLAFHPSISVGRAPG